MELTITTLGFKKLCLPLEESMSKVRGNWLNAGNSQVLINHKMLAECMLHRSLWDKYDLFVLGAEIETH